MSDHFRAFSFVDQITDLQPGKSVRGEYHIPKHLDAFSLSLVAESVGQCAAWAAMAAVDFKTRPVAGIAGLVEMLHPVQPGDTLELAAELESVDEEALAYRAFVNVNGVAVLRLNECVGPMLPVGDLDDPEAMRARFQLLVGSGVAPGAFAGVPALMGEEITFGADPRVSAVLRIPAEAPFFADHFPRRPVFPGSLLMQTKLNLVVRLVERHFESAPGGRWRITGVSGMKLRSFIAPGEALQLGATLEERSAEAATVAVESRRNGKLAGAARVLLQAVET